MATSVKGLTVEIGGDTTTLQKALNDTTSTTKSLQTELNYVNKALQLDPTNVEMLTQKKKLLNDAITETSTKIDAMKQAQAEADKLMQEGVEIDQESYRQLERMIVFAEESLESYQAELKNCGVTLEDVAEKMEAIGTKAVEVGEALLPITAAITTATTAATVMASGFEDGMAKVSTIMDETEVSIEDMSTAIMNLSDQTGVSATDLTEHVYNAISAGQDTADAVAFVENATTLAKAGFADTGDALDVLTTIMNAYGLEASEVNNVSDMLIQTQNLGKTTVAELATTMGTVIPTANSLNVGLDNLTASYTILTAQGISTSESTTYLSAMLNELGDSGTTVGALLQEKTGKSFSELMEEGASLGDVLGIISEQAEADGIAFSEMWSSTSASKAGITLLADEVEGFNDRLVEMNDCTGSTEVAFEKLQTTSYDVEIIINKLKNTMITFGETILNMIAPTLEIISEKVEMFTLWINSLSEAQKESIIKMALMVAAIAPILIIVGKIIIAISSLMTSISNIKKTITTLKTTITAVKTAMTALNATMLANPIAVIIIAIVALIAAIVLLYNNCDWFKEKVDFIFTEIKNTISNVVEAIVVFFKETIPQALSSLYDSVLEILTAIGDFFMETWNTIVLFFTESIPSFIDRVINWIDELPYYIGYMLGVLIGTIAQFGIDVITWVATNIPIIINNIVTFFATLPEKIWTCLTNAYAAVVLWGSNLASKAYEIGSTFITTVVDWISSLPEKIATKFDLALTKVKTWGTNMASLGKDAMLDLIDNIIDAATDIPSQMKEIGTNIVSGVWQGIVNAKTEFVNNIKSFFTGIVDGAKEALDINSPSRVMSDEVGEQVPAGAAEGISKKASMMKTAVTSMIGSAVDGAKNSITNIADVAYSIGGTAIPVLANSSTSTASKSVYNNISITTNSVDTNSIDEICDEINRRLGDDL